MTWPYEIASWLKIQLVSDGYRDERTPSGVWGMLLLKTMHKATNFFMKYVNIKSIPDCAHVLVPSEHEISMRINKFVWLITGIPYRE